MTQRILSTEENKAVARRLFDEGLNKHNPALLDEICTPDYVPHIIAPGIPANREGAKAFLSGYFRAYPDLRFTIDDIIAEGDRVVVRYTGSGTHQGDLMGIAPTGKSMTASAVLIIRVEEGKIAEDWLHLDGFAMLQHYGGSQAQLNAAGT